LTLATRSPHRPRIAASQHWAAIDGPRENGDAHTVIALSEQQIIDQLAQRLVDAHATVEPAQVAKVVHEQYARFEGRPIRDFIPLFVERNATAELTRINA